MPKRSPPPALPDIDAVMDLAQALDRASARDPALGAARLEEVIRLVPGKRAILGGTFGGRPAIFRFHIENPEQHAARDWAELMRTADYMGTGKMRVNAPLHHAPGLGLVVVERVAGTPLMQHIWQSAHEDRAAWLGPAAEWLRKYTAPTEARAPARLDGWFSRGRRAMARQPFEALRPLEAALMEELVRIAAALAGTPWRMAICHGDFHPNNLLVNGSWLTGIDTGGSARLPIYKDMARFLSHMGRRGLAPSGRWRFGVDRAGIAAFARAFGLDETERALWLPFMIGIEALVRVESTSLSRARIRHSTAFHEALLEDMRDIRP